MMKKKIISLALCGVLLLSALAGCGKKTDNEKEGDGSQTVQDMPSMEKIKVEKYISIPEYKGIALEKIVDPVTDQEVEDEVTYQLSLNPLKLTDPAEKVTEGDTVNIDYEGKMDDGKAFDGGSAKGANLVIGSGQFIEGFEDGLVGLKAGTKVDLPLKFPEDYGVETLKGQSVVFTVTINSISRPVKKITDAWVKSNSEVASVDAYYELIRKRLTDNANKTAEANLQATAWQKVFENVKAKEYPKELYEYGENQYKNQVKSYAQNSGQTVTDYLKAQGISKEEYKQQKKQAGESIAKQLLVLQGIIDKEGMTTKDKEYKEEMKKYLSQFGLKEDEASKQFGERNLYYAIMLQRVTGLIVKEAKIKEVSQDTAGAVDGESGRAK